MSEGWANENFTGQITEISKDPSFIMVQESGKPNARKIWKGRRYTGPPPPPVGTWVNVEASRAPAKPPNKYGSLYMDSWQLAEAPQAALTGPSEPPGAPKQRFVGREPGMADYWTAMRWAYSCALDLLKIEGRPVSLDEIQKLAGDVFSRAHVDALWKYEELEQPEASNA